jgi:zinc transport system substrate-binding protein
MMINTRLERYAMMKWFIRSIALWLLSGFPFLSPAWAGEMIPVFVSIMPQKFFLEQIGQDRVDVQVMVEPGASPHSYEPKPGQMVAISRARVYFATGVSFEKAWLEKIRASNPRMLVVHTDHGIKKRPMAAHIHGEEKHHDEAHHDDGALDPHIWLSPPLVMVQARNILTALQEVDPAHHAVYEANYQAFVAMLAGLDGELRSVFAGRKGLAFMVFHPAWGYFAEAYGLRQVPIEIEGKDPKPAQLMKLIDHAREHHIKVVFVQPQFSSKSAEQVAREIGGQVAFVDPLALNWEENLREAATKFKAAMN